MWTCALYYYFFLKIKDFKSLAMSPKHSPPPDAVAYAALLRNELLGAGIETVPDPHTDDRRHAVLSQDSHSLFRVRVMH